MPVKKKNKFAANNFAEVIFMKMKNKQFQNKKADMQFWLVMLVLALIFLVIMFFVMRGVFESWGKSTSKIQEDIEKQQKETTIFEGLGDSEEISDTSSSASK